MFGRRDILACCSPTSSTGSCQLTHQGKGRPRYLLYSRAVVCMGRLPGFPAMALAAWLLVMMWRLENRDKLLNKEMIIDNLYFIILRPLSVSFIHFIHIFGESYFYLQSYFLKSSFIWHGNLLSIACSFSNISHIFLKNPPVSKTKLHTLLKYLGLMSYATLKCLKTCQGMTWTALWGETGWARCKQAIFKIKICVETASKELKG